MLKGQGKQGFFKLYGKSFGGGEVEESGPYVIDKCRGLVDFYFGVSFKHIPLLLIWSETQNESKGDTGGLGGECINKVGF